MLDPKEEVYSAICNRLDKVDCCAHHVASYGWPRFAITTVLCDYLCGDLVYEFTDIQPAYAEAASFVRRAFIAAYPGDAIQFNSDPDFVLFNIAYYFTLLWVNLRRDAVEKFADKTAAMNTGYAWFDMKHNPPQLNEEERRLFKQGLVVGPYGKPSNKPRTFKFESMSFSGGRFRGP